MNNPVEQARQFATAGMQALSRGDGLAAETALVNAIQAGWPGPDVWVALATAFAMQGKAAERVQCFQRALEIDGGHVRANLYMGDVSEFEGQKERAALFFRRGLLAAEGSPQRDDETMALVGRAEAFFASHPEWVSSPMDALVSELGAGSDPEDEAFLQSIDVQVGRKRRYISEPTRYHYPGLPDRQFYRRSEFSWVSELEAKTPVIQQELQNLLLRQDAARNFTPYVERTGREAPDANHPLLNNPDWSAFYLMKQGQRQEENIALCPQTYAAIEAIGADVNPPAGPSVLFSVLKPGTRIPPHNGMLNTRLICHLPLIIPEKCGFRVGNDTRQWNPGEMLIFDDSINHEAWNLSGQTRIILLFEIWRPELSTRQREVLKAFYEKANVQAQG